MDVTLEDGSGPAPRVTVTDVTTDSIEAILDVRSGGPPRDRVWDLQVANQADGDTDVLPGGVTVSPQ